MIINVKENFDNISIIDYLTAKKINFDANRIFNLLKSHPDYPSALAYHEVLYELEIKNYILKISPESINKLPKYFIAILRDEIGQIFYAFIEKKGKNFIFKKKGIRMELKKDQLEELWLGLVLLIDEKVVNSESFDLKSSNALSNKKTIIPKNNDRIIGLGNIFIDKGISNNIFIDIIGNNNRIILKKGSELLNCNLYFRGNNNFLEIGENCRLKNINFGLEDSDSSIRMGKNTTIESAFISAIESTNIIIGKDCMFSSNISLRTSDSHSIVDLTTNKRNNFAKDITIGDHVWIGANVTILKGVQIESSSIISLGAIVTKNIPGNAIAAGVPAKVIKTNISWKRELI